VARKESSATGIRTVGLTRRCASSRIGEKWGRMGSGGRCDCCPPGPSPYVTAMHESPDIAALASHLDGLGRVLLGYSGGVDSALLAVVATRALGAQRFLAVIGRSDSYPEVQHQGALDIARQFGIPLLEVATRELDD